MYRLACHGRALRGGAWFHWPLVPAACRGGQVAQDARALHDGRNGMSAGWRTGIAVISASVAL